MNLNNLTTVTTVEFSPEFKKDTVIIDNETNYREENRVVKHLDLVRKRAFFFLKAKVVSNGNIEIDAEIKSLSRAAQELLGYNYGVAGPLYWMYEDETLDERRKRIESE